MQITGLPPTKPLFVRRKAAERALSLQKFELSQQAPKILKDWKHSKVRRDKQQTNLSTHILNRLEGETRYVQKARYAYLAAHVARQRAHSEAEDTALRTAELHRQALYQRQLTFQRQLTSVRVLVKRLYPAYPLRKRRVISNSVLPIGHVDFPQQMRRLGLLPVPHPRPRSEAPHSHRQLSLPVNFSKLLQVEIPVPKRTTDSQLHNTMATRIQAHFRGFIAHRQFTALRRIASYMKHCFLRRKLRLVFLRGIARNRRVNSVLGSLFQRLRDDQDMRTVMSEKRK